MDLNHPVHRHQVSLMQAAAAACPVARIAHEGLAAGYAARNTTLRAQTGAGFSFGSAAQ